MNCNSQETHCINRNYKLLVVKVICVQNKYYSTSEVINPIYSSMLMMIQSMIVCIFIQKIYEAVCSINLSSQYFM